VWRPRFLRRQCVVRACRGEVQLWQSGRDGFVLVDARAIGEGTGQPTASALKDSLTALLVANVTPDDVAGSTFDLVLESAWMPTVSLDTGTSLWAPVQLEALLRHRLEQSYADDATSVGKWDVRIDHCPGDVFALGYAVDPATRDAALQACAIAGLKWHSLQPAFNWGWQQLASVRRRVGPSRPHVCWLWAEADRALTAMVVRGRTMALNPAGALPRDDAEAVPLARREAARFGFNANEIHVISAGWQSIESGAHRVFALQSPAIDFLRPRRQPKLGWWLLALGAGLLLTVAPLHQQREIQRTEQEVAALQREATQRRTHEAASRPKVLSADERRVQRIAGQLQQPWLATLRAIEGATEAPVYLLGLAIDPASGKIQLDAESADFDHALAYVQRLSEDGALSTVQLASHESIVDPSGKPAVRFTVVGEWSRR